MTIWKNSKMTSFFASPDEAERNYDCIVKIDDNEIVVEYKTHEIVTYKGVNNHDGHFDLYAPVIRSRASLHMSTCNTFLEGSWIEGNDRRDSIGMWRIFLHT